MSHDHDLFDRTLLRQRRQRIAPGIAGYDFLLRRLADDFCDRLSLIRRDFPMAVNLGAHHGGLSRQLRAQLGMAGSNQLRMIIDVDAAPAMLSQCDGPCVSADEEFFPFADGALDLVLSGLALHFVNDLPGTLAQVCRALKPDGLFLAGLLGGQTLQELRDAFMSAELECEGGASPRVAPFADLRDLGALMQRAGFALPVVDSDRVEVSYETPFALMSELRAMGGSNVLNARHRRPLRRATLMRAAQIYMRRYGLPDGRIKATFEIVTLTGWAPHEDQQKPLRPGSAQARLADALGVKEISAGEKTGDD